MSFNISNYVLFGFIAVAIFTVYMAFISAFKHDRTQSKVKQISPIIGEEDDEYNKVSGIAVLLKGILIILGVDFTNQRDNALSLGKAGYNTQNALIYFLFFKRCVQPFLLFVGAILLTRLLINDFAKIKDHMAMFLSSILLIIIGAFGSNLFLSNSATKRTQKLMKTFPDALDLLLISVESGLGIDAAFARVTKEMKDTHPIIASEFERTKFEMTMMSDRIQALQNFADRTNTEAVRSLVASLIQAEKFGTSLVDTMRMIAEEQRTTRMLNAEAKAARLPALITLPLIFFILPSLFMIILGPAVIKLNQQGGLFGDGNR